MLICLRTNPITRLRADLPTEPTLRWHRTATAFASHEYHINRVYILPSSVARITTIITPPEESRPASTRLQHQHAFTTPARVYNASTRLQRQHVFTTPARVYNASTCLQRQYASTMPTYSPSSALSNLPVSAAAINPQWHHPNFLRGIEAGTVQSPNSLAISISTTIRPNGSFQLQPPTKNRFRIYKI